MMTSNDRPFIEARTDFATGDVHVFPIDDLIAHEEDTLCPCGPAIEPVPESGNKIIIHHSLDGRESSQ